MSLGKIYVVAAPSGAGKSTLVDALCKIDNNIQVSISHTTREIRPGEINGVNYFFVSIAKFEQMVKNNEFLEYAKVYGNYYGTNLSTINKFLDTGKDLILEIDWQGAHQVCRLFNDAVLIFILPPSLEVLAKRLYKRKTDSLEIINQRLKEAKQDISHVLEFDYAIINDDFDNALYDIYSIIRAGRNKVGYKIEMIKHQFDL